MEKQSGHRGIGKTDPRANFPQVTWTSGRLDGVRLLIELKENDMPVPEETSADPKTGRDLVSQYDGVITEMIVRSGVPKVTTGSEVAKGDILVEGRIPIYAEDGTVREYRPVVRTPISEWTYRYFRGISAGGLYPKKYTGREKTYYFLHFGDREWSPKVKSGVFAIRQHP